jgi:hypothetical protein
MIIFLFLIVFIQLFPIERILQYKLNPKKCIFIGDMKTDETTAMRLNIKFINTDDFLKK